MLIFRKGFAVKTKHLFCTGVDRKIIFSNLHINVYVEFGEWSSDFKICSLYPAPAHCHIFHEKLKLNSVSWYNLSTINICFFYASHITLRHRKKGIYWKRHWNLHGSKNVNIIQHKTVYFNPFGNYIFTVLWPLDIFCTLTKEYRLRGVEKYS